ncbi:hypothetical protein BDV95DRAFT_587554 [Massariosphaeria phaeospora]|uniref:2,6-dihydroxypyridine 3-monooxygenase substrate binding domain-containing protein n=1 Tax=Massariosphaeria phaeospora TaxID=100035 RepID=A0A7C8M1A2_9PLEO|nr:hypothetical protein BDV95DRAFT_587554 [Massariosphaeria phaeospora]
MITSYLQIGGSLSGLMCGIVLVHAGHKVTIIEKDTDERQSHMAGVALGSDADQYLASHDRMVNAFSHRSLRVQALNADETIRIFVNGRRDITSWDTYYFRLRAILDHNNQQQTQTMADLVIGADGPDSFVRSKYLPTTKRQYVGYIAWRGTVAETEVSASTRETSRRSVTVHMMHRHHCIMYTIPGANGSLESGERLLNFLWYTNESQGALQDILKDRIDGRKHHNLVPAGRVREEVWNAQIGYTKSVPLPTPFLEVMLKIRRPFIQVITEFCSPRAAFEDGRVLLVGDALSLFRPHTAFSATQAAFHASRVEEYVSGKISLQAWEVRVLRYSCLHWAQSIWWGKFYQDHMSIAVLAGFRYWWYCGTDRVLSWWNMEDPLLRTSSNRVEEYDW